MSSIYGDKLTNMLSDAQSIRVSGEKSKSLYQNSSDLLTQKQNPNQRSFLEYVKDGVRFVDAAQKSSDKMSTNLATGAEENIHETMLSVSQAEVSFKLMVQVRNKILEAYQEVMRMQV